MKESSASRVDNGMGDRVWPIICKPWRAGGEVLPRPEGHDGAAYYYIEAAGLVR